MTPKNDNHLEACRRSDEAVLRHVATIFISALVLMFSICVGIRVARDAQDRAAASGDVEQ